jgi:hypothetical protein
MDTSTSAKPVKTRGAFLKRTPNTAFAVALSLNQFRSEENAPGSGSSSSGGTPTAALTISTPKIDLGSIVIGEVPELPGIQAKLEEIKALQEQLQARLNAGIKTKADVEAVKVIAEQIRDLQNELKSALPLTLTPSSDQAAAPVARLTLSSSPTPLPGEVYIDGPVQAVRARPGNPVDSLGSLTFSAGNTTYDAIFTPNGNYGFVAFRGKVSWNGKVAESGVVLLEITGQCREQAQAALEAEIARMTRAATFAALLGPALGAVVSAVMRAVILSFIPAIGQILTVLLILIAILVAVAVILQIREEVERNIKRLREQTQPIIDLLPPCA